MKELGAYPLEFGQETQPVDLFRLFSNVDHVLDVTLGRGAGSATQSYELTSEISFGDPLIQVAPGSNVTLTGFSRRTVQSTVAQATDNTLQAWLRSPALGTVVWEKDIVWDDAGSCEDTLPRTLAASIPFIDVSSLPDSRIAFRSRNTGGTGRTICRNTGQHQFYILIAGSITEIRNPGNFPAQYQPISIERLK